MSSTLTWPSDAGSGREVAATFYDGATSKPHAVRIAIDSGYIRVLGEGIERRLPLEAVEITEALGSTPRLVRFSDGAVCEVADLAGLAAILAGRDRDRGVAGRLMGHAAWLAGAAVASVVLLAAGYFYGVPALAKAVADRMPSSAVKNIGVHALQILDATVFDPSKIPQDRRAMVLKQFNDLRLPASPDELRRQVEFRSSGAVGPNALALPSGVIVVTDDLVTLATDDRQIVAVLAHEAGHLARRHGLRQVLQSSAVALFLTWYVGDVSGLAAIAPTALLEARYSRDLEREADDYAASVLRDNGISPAHLADMLERMTASRQPRRVEDPPPRDYLSTHPSTAERIAALRAGAR
jgi:Zn-dependent protease with chaperone function